MVKSWISIRACVWSLIASLLLCACQQEQPQVPPEHLRQEKMVDILVDIHIVEGAKVGRKIMGDTLTADIYYTKVYQKHGVGKEEFTRSFNYYSTKPAMMNKIYEKVLDSLNKVDVRSFEQIETQKLEKGIRILSPVADTVISSEAQDQEVENNQEENPGD